MEVWTKNERVGEAVSAKALRQRERQRLKGQAEGSVEWLGCPV